MAEATVSEEEQTMTKEAVFILGFFLGVFVSSAIDYSVISESPQSKIVRSVFPDIEMRKATDPHKPIASAGEWITDPDSNSPICKLTQDLAFGMTMNVGRCTDWKTPIPHDGETVSFLRWSPLNGSQVHVEGQWRP